METQKQAKARAKSERTNVERTKRTKMYYEIKITETATSKPGNYDETHWFNKIIEKFKTKEEALNYLIERYGKFDPKKCAKMYHDSNNEQCGYIKSFWNKDISHDSKNWWQTDWITVEMVETNFELF